MKQTELNSILFFLSELKENNNRDWFHGNKKKYEDARDIFISFIENLIPAIRKIDAGIGDIQAKECIFRIYKDVRFSKDKTPYKTNLGAFITAGGRKSGKPGYYVHLEPGTSFIAGGIYQPPPDILKAVRTEIYYNSAGFRKIISNKEFIKVFGGITDSQKLKRAPKGFPPDFPEIDLLKFKNYTVIHYVSDEIVLSGAFTNYIKDICTTMYTLNKFLAHAIDMSEKEN